MTAADWKALGVLATSPNGQALLGGPRPNLATIRRPQAHHLVVFGLAREINAAWIEITEDGRSEWEWRRC